MGTHCQARKVSPMWLDCDVTHACFGSRARSLHVDAMLAGDAILAADGDGDGYGDADAMRAGDAEELRSGGNGDRE